LIIIGSIIAGLYVLGLIAGPPAPLPSRSETVTARCAEEFPYDTNAQRECYAAIMYRDAQQAKRDKLERAGR
jgi:hypothetical protein